jgi:pyruvate/2-oxoglutarate dehydrogenase complex dihydrolipoamide acyltransferase (E2) component
MDLIGKYEKKRNSNIRKIIIDTLEIGIRKHNVKALLEIDITDARKYIKQYRKDKGRGLSFTAWVIKCIGKAMNEHKQLNAYRKGQNIIVFDDIDISMTIEREVKGEKVPMPYVIRKVNEKSLDQIHNEITNAQTQSIDDKVVIGEDKFIYKLYEYLPKFIRMFIWKIILNNPFLLKKMMGTVVLTSLSMFGKVSGWAIPTSIHPICFAPAGVVRKAGVVNDRKQGERVEIKEYLNLTILFDHDVIDGAPSARFVATLVRLMESAYGLKD